MLLLTGPEFFAALGIAFLAGLALGVRLSKDAE